MQQQQQQWGYQGAMPPQRPPPHPGMQLGYPANGSIPQLMPPQPMFNPLMLQQPMTSLNTFNPQPPAGPPGVPFQRPPWGPRPPPQSVPQNTFLRPPFARPPPHPYAMNSQVNGQNPQFAVNGPPPYVPPSGMPNQQQQRAQNGFHSQHQRGPPNRSIPQRQKGGKGSGNKPIQGHNQQQQQQANGAGKALGPPSKKSLKKQQQNMSIHLSPQEAAIKVRDPETSEERAEVEAWKASRRQHWPSDDNMQQKQQEMQEKQARGELHRNGTQKYNAELAAVLARQRDLGVAGIAGTADMVVRGQPPVAQVGSKRAGPGSSLPPDKRFAADASASGVVRNKWLPPVGGPRGKPTLLQKLHAKDTRRSYSYLLQCFRYFVEHDFLQDNAARPAE